MFARISLFLNCFILLFISTSTTQAATFLESGGKVVIEAESSSAKGQWARQSKIGGAKGGAYLIWNGPDLFSGKAAGRDTLRYTFRVQKAGNYELRWRSYIAHGNNATEANDSWVRFPTGKNIKGQHGLNGWTKVFMNQPKQWSWSAKTVDHVGKSVRQYFSKGDHVMEISGRSHGHAIDRMVLFRYAEISYSQNKFDGYKVSSTVGGKQEPEDNDAEDKAKALAEQKAKEEAAKKAKEEAAQKAKEEAAQKAKEEAAQKAKEEAAQQAKEEAAQKAKEEAEQIAQAEADQKAKEEADAAQAVLADDTQSNTVEAPVVSVNGNTLTWNAVDAVSINVHGQNGEWLESLSGSATRWSAPSSGNYFIVATNEGGWEYWGRSNTVEVAKVNAAPVQTNLSSAVYSSTAGELFWSVEGAIEQYQVELDKNGVSIFTGSALSYFDDQLAPGTTYQYQLRILNSGQVVAEQSTVLTTQGSGNNAVDQNASSNGLQSVQLRGEVYSQSAVELSWDRSAHAESASFTYNLYQDDQLVSNTDALSYFVDGLNAGQTYRFTLRVQDTAGNEGESYSIMLSTHSADGSSVLSFGKPAESSTNYGNAVWNALPLSTQQRLPSDCVLSQGGNGLVYCYSARDDRLLARSIDAGNSYWSYRLNVGRSVSLLEMIGSDRLMLVSESKDCLDCSRFAINMINQDGAIGMSAALFEDTQGAIAHGVDASGIRFERSSDGSSVFLAAKSFSAIDGSDTADVNGWYEIGVRVVELDAQTGAALNVRLVENADFSSLVLAD